MTAILFLLLASGFGEQIRDPAISLFNSMPGDTVSELNSSLFQDSFWVEIQRLEVSLDEDSSKENTDR